MYRVLTRRYEATSELRENGYCCRGALIGGPGDSEEWENRAGDIAIITALPDGSYSLFQPE